MCVSALWEGTADKITIRSYAFQFEMLFFMPLPFLKEVQGGNDVDVGVKVKGRNAINSGRHGWGDAHPGPGIKGGRSRVP